MASCYEITAVKVFETLSEYVKTQEGKVMYILTMVCVFMAIDFILGSLAAWRNPNIKFRSNEGINGILRKVASLIVLVMCIPVSVLIPSGAGIVTLYILYLGYLIMEFSSIIENLDKLGVHIAPLKIFAAKLGANAGKSVSSESISKNSNFNDEYMHNLSKTIEDEINNILNKKDTTDNKDANNIEKDLPDELKINLNNKRNDRKCLNSNKDLSDKKDDTKEAEGNRMKYYRDMLK